MTSGRAIKTYEKSLHLRELAIDVKKRQVLISRLAGSEQEVDFSQPANCDGFGRIRHFRSHTPRGWPKNSLPISPACKALGIIPVPDVMRAQVFQNAACAWRCWYCFVPYALLSANPAHSEWISPERLIELYVQEGLPAAVVNRFVRRFAGPYP